MKNGKDLADYAIEIGSKKGVKYIEARFLQSITEGYTTRNGGLVSGGTNKNVGIGIRVLADGGLGFFSTANLNKSNIESAVKKAIKMAKTCDRKTPINFSEEPIVTAKWKTNVKEPFEDISDEEKIELITDIDKQLQAQDYAENLVVRTLMLNLIRNKKYIVTSEGSQVESDKSLITFYTYNTAKGPKGTEQRFYGDAASKGWEWFDENNVIEGIINDNAALVKATIQAEDMTLGKIDVIVSGEVSGIIAHENTGHPSEGDRILGREGAQAGESFYIDLLEEGELGEIKLGTEAVNLIDDPTLPDSPGYYEYDDECVKAKPRYLIKEGRMNELLLNREFAARFNTHSTAAARAISFNREPIIRMANTYFAPGDYEIEELIEDVKKGIYMKSFTEWNIDDRRFQSKYVGLEVYLIENGELTDKMIRRPVLELTTFGIFGCVDAVAKDFEATYGTCGKGDPMQGVPVWMGGAHVRMRDIRLGG
ncbi:MAG: TldD/PmbA family protein [Asgard group archaeon]|nr:TldD/PmbA family protein [Asgard group archaeon]